MSLGKRWRDWKVDREIRRQRRKRKMTVFRRMKKFINIVVQYLIRLHRRAMELGPEGPYNVLLYWTIDVLQYGTVIAFIVAVVGGFPTAGKFVLNALAFGMVKWLWTEFIKMTTDPFKGKKE